MSVSKITGMEKLFADLRSFPQKIKQQALNGALRKGAVPIQQSVKRLTPRKTGKLAGNVVVVTDKKPWLAGMDARVVVMVRWRGKTGSKYWRYQEFGTSHMAPHPFMRPGFAMEAQNAIVLILSDLARSIPRIAKTL